MIAVGYPRSKWLEINLMIRLRHQWFIKPVILKREQLLWFCVLAQYIEWPVTSTAPSLYFRLQRYILYNVYYGCSSINIKQLIIDYTKFPNCKRDLQICVCRIFIIAIAGNSVLYYDGWELLLMGLPWYSNQRNSSDLTDRFCKYCSGLIV